MYEGELSKRRERKQISSIEVLAEVTSSGESNVKPEHAGTKHWQRKHDLVEVNTNNNNQSIIMSKANKICEHPLLFNF